MFSLNTLSKYRISNGRIFVYEQNTTELADVYTYENSEYTPAQNPIYVVGGLPDNTYFLKNKIYDVLAQEYEGDSSHPEGDLRPEMWSESFTTKIGFDYDKDERETETTTVKTIADLKDLAVGGIVNVVGYWTDNDCESRTYYWDETCVNDPDEGLIIQSNNEDTGRWILVCNEIMKSEYYGVYGTHQENLINLFKYNDQYGSMSLVSPKTIMLAPGAYGDGYTLYNGAGKKVIFSKGATINDGNVVRCDSYEGTGAIGAIQTNSTVRLSNFKDLLTCLNSQSQCIIFDDDSVKTLDTTKTLNDIKCVFEKNLYVTGNGHLIFDDCAIESDRKIAQNGIIHFQNCAVCDNWFTNPWNVLPNPTYDTDIEVLNQNFQYADTYLRYLNVGTPSSINANCVGMTMKGSFSFGNANQEVNITGLETTKSLTINSPSASLVGCKIANANISSPYLTVKDSTVESGCMSANNNVVYRYFDRSNIGHNVDLSIENATTVRLSSYRCNYNDRINTFYSNSGCAIGGTSHTDFRDNYGMNETYEPMIMFSGDSLTPSSIVNERTMVITAQCGKDNWEYGLTTYQMRPWATYGGNALYVRMIDTINKNYDYTMDDASIISYAGDFERFGGRVYDFTNYVVSAKWHEPVPGIDYLYNDFTKYLGLVKFVKVRG